LGKEIPKEIEKIKKECVSEIYNKTWLNQFNKIKETLENLIRLLLQKLKI
jgi:hypothetical protein